MPNPIGRSSLLRGVGVSAVGNLFPPLASLATAPMLAHSLGASGRGGVASVAAPLLLATLVAQGGIPLALTHLVSRQGEAAGILLRRGLLLLLASGSALAAAFICAVPLAGLDRDGTALVVVAATGLLPTLFVSALQATAAGLGRWRLIAAERLVGAVVRLVFVGGLAVTDRLTVFAAVAVLVLAPIVGGFVYIGLRREPRLALLPSSTTPPSILRYGFPVWLGSLSGVLLARLDQVLLGPLTDSEQLGLYAVAVTVGELPLVVNSAVRDVVFARASSGRDGVDLARAARLSTLIVGLIAIPLSVTVTLWMPIAFGVDFIEAAPLAVVLLVAAVVANPGSVAGAGLGGQGRPGLRSAALVVAGGVNLLLLVLLVPWCGAMGAAIATLVGGLVASQLNISLLRHVAGLPIRSFYGMRRHDLRLVLGLRP